MLADIAAAEHLIVEAYRHVAAAQRARAVGAMKAPVQELARAEDCLAHASRIVRTLRARDPGVTSLPHRRLTGDLKHAQAVVAALAADLHRSH